jgi:hypothetical protein
MGLISLALQRPWITAPFKCPIEQAAADINDTRQAALGRRMVA